MKPTALLLLALVATPLAAQNSILGVRGIGFPGRLSSAQSRGMAGADQITDQLSALNPGAVALFPQATAAITVSGGFRSYDIGTASVSGLRETRFPVVVAGGRLGQRVGFGLSLSTYADRTWDVTSSDTVTLRGAPVAVTDRVRSLGAIADIGGAFAYRPIPQLAIGVALHAITGSSRLDARRAFADSAYRPYEQSAQTAFRGWGGGIGIVASPVRGLQVGASYRTDGTLSSDVDSVPLANVPLPSTFAGGLAAGILPGLKVAATAIYRTWSDAAGAFAVATDVYDTWELSGGFTLGGESGPPIPIRLGMRYAQLPFAPAGTARPHETDFAVGTGFRFAQGRALFDWSVERVRRSGGGVTERAWQITVGMTVRP